MNLLDYMNAAWSKQAEQALRMPVQGYGTSEGVKKEDEERQQGQTITHEAVLMRNGFKKLGGGHFKKGHTFVGVMPDGSWTHDKYGRYTAGGPLTKVREKGDSLHTLRVKLNDFRRGQQ